MSEIYTDDPELIKEVQEKFQEELSKCKNATEQIIFEKSFVNILRILKDTKLLDNLIEETNKKVTGEIEARKVILLIANGRNVENPNEKASSNLIVNSLSGAGKDYIVNNTLAVLPDDELIKRKRITKKVFTYWHNAKFEPTWSWNKKVFCCEDIPNSVLNEDVFKVMASSGNASSTVVINQRAIDIEVKGKPALIVTIAEANPKSENLRRFPILTLNESVEQTKSIMKKQATFAETGIPESYDSKYKDALKHLKSINVKIPFAKALVKAFPEIHLILRTNFNRFLDYIKFSCSLYQYQREIDSNGYYIAVKQDYNNAKLIFEKTTTNIATIPLTQKQKNILEIIKKLGEGEYTEAELSLKISFISKRRLGDTLDKLVNLGFLTTDSKPSEYEKTFADGSIKKVKGRPVQTYKLLKFSNLNLPTFTEIMSVMSETSTMTDMSITSNTKKIEVMDVNDIIDMQIQDKKRCISCEKEYHSEDMIKEICRFCKENKKEVNTNVS